MKQRLPPFWELSQSGVFMPNQHQGLRHGLNSRQQVRAPISVCLCVFVPLTNVMRSCDSLHKFVHV